MIKEQFLEGLRSGVHPPIPVKFNRQNRESKDQAISIAKDVTRLLNGEGIEPIVVGSSSVFLQIGPRYPRSPHDVDFLVREGEIEGVRRVLERNGFSFWEENFIHWDVRNLTGGFGRHHEYGASNSRYLQETGLPFWIGFFCYRQDVGEKTTFRENYAVSCFKIKQAIKDLLSKQPDFDQRIKLEIAELLRGSLTLENIYKIIEILKSQGVDFWEILFTPEVNEVDIRRRNTLPPYKEEYFLEVEVVEKYNVPFDTLCSTKQVRTLDDTGIQVITIANSYLRMSKFYPHYLGKRKKYKQSAEFIESSGVLPGEETERLHQVFNDRLKVHTPVGVYKFREDKTLNERELTGNSKNSDVDYWALLLEGVHYKKI